MEKQAKNIRESSITSSINASTTTVDEVDDAEADGSHFCCFDPPVGFVGRWVTQHTEDPRFRKVGSTESRHFVKCPSCRIVELHNGKFRDSRIFCFSVSSFEAIVLNVCEKIFPHE